MFTDEKWLKNTEENLSGEMERNNKIIAWLFCEGKRRRENGSKRGNNRQKKRADAKK